MYNTNAVYSVTLLYIIILSNSGTLTMCITLSHSGTLLHVHYNIEPFWHANAVYSNEPFWHAIVVHYNLEQFWHANVHYNLEPFCHANAVYSTEPFWHANAVCIVMSHSGTLMLCITLNQSGTLLILSHSVTLTLCITLSQRKANARVRKPALSPTIVLTCNIIRHRLDATLCFCTMYSPVRRICKKIALLLFFFALIPFPKHQYQWHHSTLTLEFHHIDSAKYQDADWQKEHEFLLFSFCPQSIGYALLFLILMVLFLLTILDLLTKTVFVVLSFGVHWATYNCQLHIGQSNKLRSPK